MLRHVASGTTSPPGAFVPGRWSIRWVSCFALSLQIEFIPQSAFLWRNSNMEAENEDSLIFRFNVVPLNCIFFHFHTLVLKQTIPAPHPDLPCFRSCACSRLTVQVYKCSSGKYMVDVLVPQAHLNPKQRFSELCESKSSDRGLHCRQCKRPFSLFGGSPNERQVLF